MVEVDGTLSIADVAAVALDGASVSLDRAASSEMERSRAVVADIVAAEERRVYGVNTGYGDLKDVPVSRSQLEEQQVNLLRSHDVTVGESYPPAVVRATLLVRANTLAMGFSGVRVALVERLLALLNEGVHPVVRRQGDADNAAGLANVGLVLMGEGVADVDGERLAGDEALRRAGIEPLSFRPKEGIALISGTPVMTASLALALRDAETLLALADVTGAWVFSLVGNEPGAFAERVSSVRPLDGQRTVAKNLRELTGDQRSDGTDMSQDPLSIRCMPQVHGAGREMADFARRMVETELRSATDNPLVFPDGSVYSNGNFNGQHVASAADALGRALLAVGTASEKRFARLLEGGNGVPAHLTDSSGLESGPSRLQYAAASVLAEASTRGTASDRSFVTAGHQEDVHAVGNVAAASLSATVESVRYVLAMELLGAARAVQFDDGRLPAPLRRVREHVDSVVDVPTDDVSWAPLVESLNECIQSDAFRDLLADVTPSE